MSDLLERLGRPDDARMVILVCDGLGSSNAANMAILDALRTGVATSAGLQVPCPWARAAAASHQGEDVGVCLTVNAEHELYRWGPVTQAPSLLSGEAGFPRTPADLWEHADVDEVRRECRSQLERAVLWGYDPTHLSAHLSALCARAEFFDVYLDLAIEFALPMSLPDPTVDLGFPARDLAAAENIVVPDRVVTAPAPERGARPAIDAALAALEPGVTEMHVAPAADTPEIRAITPHWPARVADAHLVTFDWTFRSMLGRSGAELIGFRDLRRVQRAADADPG
ncbi:MAG: ChbG/HpnK family deacetylase [Acidimicrobiales bacterium]